MKKTLKKLVSLLVAAVMVMGLSAIAFADTTAGAASVAEDTRKVGVTLSKGTDSSDQFVDADHSYKAIKLLDLYKILDPDGEQAVDSDGNLMWQYRIADEGVQDIEDILEDAGFSFNPKTGAIEKNNADITSMKGVNENTSDAAKLAALLAQAAVTEDLAGVDMTLNATTQLESGYYVIFESDLADSNDGSVATKPILVDVKTIEGESGINLTLKDAKVELVKEIVNDDAYSSKQDTRSFGDEVEFKVTTNFPVYEADASGVFQFSIQDNMSGLSLITTSITVKVDGGTVAEGDDSFSLDADEDGLDIDFESDFILDHQGDSIVVEYSAIVDAEDAHTNAENGNANNVQISYTRNPEVMSDVTNLYDETQVFSYAFQLNKIDGASDEFLAGVVFELYKDGETDPMSFDVVGVTSNEYDYVSDGSGAVSQITTIDGSIVIRGLDEGRYILKEITPVSGYAVLGDDAEIVIDANKGDNGSLTLYRGQTAVDETDGSATITSQYAGLIDERIEGGTEGNEADTGNDGMSKVYLMVRNYKGVALPETGSVAAIVMSVAGAMTACGGCAFFAMKKKKEDDE